MTHKSYSSGFGSVPNSTPKDNDPMERIANALEEVLRLVKKDQEESKKRWEKEDEQTTRASNGPSLPAACALAGGSGTKLQAASGKLQASSGKLDKVTLQ